MGNTTRIPIKDEGSQVRKHVYLTNYQADKLAQMAIETNRSESEIVRMLIERAETGPRTEGETDA